MASGACVARCRMFFKIDLTRFGLRTLTNYQTTTATESWSRRGRRYCTKSDDEDDDSEVSVKYIHGLPHLTVPLPSRNEKCRFALKPVSHNVGDFLHMLKSEDRGIDRAAILNSDGVRIASTCTIESLMDEPFRLHVNNKEYVVKPPKRDKISSEELTKLGDVRALVAQLYEALHVGEYHIKKEKELLERLEDLRYQITPLEERKIELDNKAVRRSNLMTWVGLGLMSVQFGILARLTWWEYSWDIMEPVTYFVTYGTGMAAYAYFCITKQEYNYPEVRERQYLITIHKGAKKKGFDTMTYNVLKRQIAELEYDLRRLRDPLNIQLPPHIERNLPQLSLTSPTSSSSPDHSLGIANVKHIRDTTASSSSSSLHKILNIATKKLKK